MTSERYRDVIALYWARQRNRLLLSAALAALGFAALCADIIVGVLGIAAGFYFIMEGVRTLVMHRSKKASLRALEKAGTLSAAMAALEGASIVQVDGLSYALTDEYLLLPHGALLKLRDIAWIYLSEHTARYFAIPVMRIRQCFVALLSGERTAAFHGKLKDKEAFKALLIGMLARNPQMMVGYSAENERAYQARVDAQKRA